MVSDSEFVSTVSIVNCEAFQGPVRKSCHAEVLGARCQEVLWFGSEVKVVALD